MSIEKKDQGKIYNRVLLKLSGEALMGNEPFGIDPVVLNQTAAEIAEITRLGVQVGIVIGGGNLFRGAVLHAVGLSRVSGDHMGMLATVMNAIALRDALERASIPTRAMSALAMDGVVDRYDVRKAIHHLEVGRVVVFAAGIGVPFFTTDSAACERGIEIAADLVLKATKVDGVYSADPFKDLSAVRYEHLTYDEVLKRDLRVMDLTAICLCKDYNMPLRVFKMGKPHALRNIVLGEPEGTLISNA